MVKKEKKACVFLGLGRITFPEPKKWNDRKAMKVGLICGFVPSCASWM